MGSSSSSTPRRSASSRASSRFSAAVNRDGIETAVTAPGPRASAATVRARAESIPPERPSTAWRNRFLRK